MILTAHEIRKQRAKGNIVIEPYRDIQMNANSYNVRLGQKFLVYNRTRDEPTIYENPKPDREFTMEMGKPFHIPAGTCLLASTIEYTETHGLVPMLEGRSSMGRQFTAIHVTAGFGDIGFCGQWTLEIVAFQNTTLWAGMEIGQLYYLTTKGALGATYGGRYLGDEGPQPVKGGGK